VPKEEVPEDNPELAAVLQLFTPQQIVEMQVSQERRKLVPLTQTLASLTNFVDIPPDLHADILALGPICELGRLANILSRDRRSKWALQPYRLVVQDALPYLLKQREGRFLVEFGMCCVAWDAYLRVISTLEHRLLTITPENLAVVKIAHADRVYRLVSKKDPVAQRKFKPFLSSAPWPFFPDASYRHICPRQDNPQDDEKVSNVEVDVTVSCVSHKRRHANPLEQQVIKKIRAELRTWIRARVKPEFQKVEYYEQVTPRAVELLRKQAKKSAKIRFANKKDACNSKILEFLEKQHPFGLSTGTEQRRLLPGDSRGLYGLFATTKLAPRHVVGAYKGSLWSADEFEEQFLNHASEDGVLDYAFDAYVDFSSKAEDHFVIVAHNFDDANALAFANDYRPDPATQNAEFVAVCWKNLPFILLITTKEIGQDEEVLVDYGAKYWQRNRSCAAELIKRLWSLLPEESETL
jgi:hypothetical protein